MARFESSSIHHFWDIPQHFLKTHVCLESGFLSFLELQKSLLVSFQGCRAQWQRFESSSIHHFWDTQQHFLKTHFCLDSGFLLFLELQKSLLVSFQGCWTQWQWFESSSIHCFWATITAFISKHILLRLSGFLSFIELQKSHTYKFSGLLNHNGKGLKALVSICFRDTQQHFLKTHVCWESGFLSFLEIQKSLLVSFQGCWTQWQRFESSSIHHIWDTSTTFSQNTSLLRKWLSFIPRAPEIPTSKFSRGCLNTMAKVWKL